MRSISVFSTNNLSINSNIECSNIKENEMLKGNFKNTVLHHVLKTTFVNCLNTRGTEHRHGLIPKEATIN